MNIIRIFFLLSFVNLSFSQTTIYLETDECVAEANAGAISSISLVYTDSGTPGLDSSDTIDTASSSNTIDYSGGTTYYYYENSTLYSVSFTTYLSTLTFSPSAATCISGSGGGSPATIYLETDECVAEANAGAISSISLVYTDSGTPGLDSSDTIDTASSSNTIDYSGGTTYYYYENSTLYSVSFTTYLSTLTFSPSITTCSLGSGGLQNTYNVYTSISDACNQTGLTFDLIISSDPDNSLEIGDSVDNINSTVPSYSSASTYYFNDGSNVYSINFLDFPTGTYTIKSKTLENCSPVIISSSTFTSDENQTSVGTISATDFEDDSLTYSISGDDLAIVESTGIITFNTAPDYETQDVYTATITVSDGISIDA
ncbi:cadherin repeat domain-containing protein, partial [Flavobacteriaceae bacterium]|nr:cadherin repeat domain-containing protein [Flavobacteriaceae bacterium]